MYFELLHNIPFMKVLDLGCFPYPPRADSGVTAIVFDSRVLQSSWGCCGGERCPLEPGKYIASKARRSRNGRTRS